MSFLDVPKEHRREYIARMLGYKPDEPASWHDMMIDAIIKHAEEAVDRRIYEIVRQVTYNPGSQRPKPPC